MKKNPRQGNEPVLILTKAAFRCGTAQIFPDTDWMIRAGEAWGIIGVTAAGKSALGDALTNVLPLVAGERRYPFLRAENEPTAHDLIHVSLESQRALLQAQDGFMQARWNSLVEEADTVREFLAVESVYGVSPYQIMDADAIPPDYPQRFTAAVRAMQIEELLERQVMVLSNGECRKVLIARALMQQPKLLVLDEAYAGLDAPSRRNLDRVIRDQTAHGMAVVLIAAHAQEIPGWCHRRRRVHGGRLCAPARGVPETPHGAPLALPMFGRRRKPPKVVFAITDGTIAYGREVILDRVNWTIRQGENWALLGPNGSGKSTLISLIIADNPQAYANRIVLFDRERGSGESIWEIKRRIGLLSPELQSYFDDGTSVLDTVLSGRDSSIGVHQSAGRKTVRKARQLLAGFGFTKHDSVLFGDLSFGQQRIVLLARSLITGPDLLILDEPCQGLDCALRTRLLEYVDWIGRSGRTQLLYVTHRPEEIPSCVTHTLRLA